MNRETTKVPPGRSGDSGAALMAFVLVIAVVGILLGFGRQRAHRYAVTRRLDRTYQIEKMLATRDALALADTLIEKTADNIEGGFEHIDYVERSMNARGVNDLQVELRYIPDKDREDMHDLGNWQRVRSHSEPGLDVAVANGSVANFTAPISTDTVYRAALVKRAASCWQDSEFGYLYRIKLAEGKDDYNLGKLNLYLVGLSGSGHWEGEAGTKVIPYNENDVYHTYLSYTSMLDECPWFKMELVAGDEATDTDENGNAERYSFRTLSISCDGRIAFSNADFIPGGKWRKGTMDMSDYISHGGGFLLTASAFCGFGENAEDGMRFSRRSDVVTSSDVGIADPDKFLAAFKDSAIVIEHVFPTNQPPGNLPCRSVTVDSFRMREPATYSVAVCNKRVWEKEGYSDKDPEEYYDGMVTTWIFQTQRPSMGYNAEQCILDTFGREPTSFFGERRGEIPVR